MHDVRPLLRASISLVAVATATQSMALGFGRSTPAATLGQPLDFVVALRLDAGESIGSDCVGAEVAVGENVVPGHAVGAGLENVGGTPQVRVRTQSAVDEPVVSVMVAVGCGARITRRFTLFADPPGTGAVAAPALALADAAAPAMLPPPLAVAPGAAEDGRGNPATPAPPPPKDAAARGPAGTAQTKLPKRTAVVRPVKPRAAAPVRQRAVAAEKPRLTLDPPVATAAAAAAAAASAAEREAALLAAEIAASAAQAAASAATSAAETRVAALEKELGALRKDSQSQRETIARMSRTLADNEDRSRWTPLLMLALAGLLGAVIWLAWRLRQVRREQETAWWSEQSVLPAGIVPAPAEAVTQAPADTLPPPLPRLSEEATAAPEPRNGAPTADGEFAMQRTAALPPGSFTPGAPVRDVSIEELIDLEQQAEFFIVLGQDEAAIDLLVGHLRSTGGTVPLPYLKLLEIYRRLGDEAAYERTRDRFNQRFNSVAPRWGTDLNSGRTLEDYPEVMARIEGAWRQPVDAMAILETLLSRTDAGALFDLPAYRDVLFLYALARDLLDRSSHNVAHVDVLLPLAGGGEFPAATTRPCISAAGDTAKPANPVEPGRPTTPADLDLTPTEREGPITQFALIEPFPSLAREDERRR